MMKFLPPLIVHKGSVLALISVVGGLLVTLTAGGPCVDVAVRMAQYPDNLLHLSNALIGLMGLRHQKHVANSLVKAKLKKLYFTHSFCSLLDMTRSSLPGAYVLVVLWEFPSFPEEQTSLKSTPTNWLSPKRCRTIFILLCGGSSQLILTLSGRSKLRSHDATNKLRWLVNLSRKVQARGDVIYLLLGEQTGQIRAGVKTKGATSENYPTWDALGLAALSAVLLWMCLPHIALCAAVCLGWSTLKHIH